ncbi:hypothetical protein PINS_up013139 [Pythium insidiosum]|nr:hypothetical protein PINS_up013139 [Pythium insidiosum]
MNLGIIHNRRPDKKAAPSNPLLSDVRLREIAKQMGLAPQDLGNEAMDVWKMLDDMAENDPTAYQQFIHEQLKDGPPQASQRRYFNPVPGLVIKCTMQSNNMNNNNNNNGKQEKLFVNLCSHEIIDLPKNPNSDREVPRDTRAVPSTSNLQIPLVVGKRRTIKDFSGAACSAIDVVVHPWVLERCAWDASFKGDVLKLALHWVQQDAKLVLVPPTGKFIKSQYKGGVSVGSEILTTRFPITPDNQQTGELAGDDEVTQNQREATAASIVMDSPSDLLKKMTLAKEEDDAKTSDILLAPVGDKSPVDSAVSRRVDAAMSEKPAPKKKLIEIIEPSSNQSSNQTAATKSRPKKTKKASSVVKRGFLNSTKTQLYPDGSSEGRPASAYVNLLSRSKVVDMSDLERQQAQQREMQAKEREELLSFLPSDDRDKATKSSTEKDHGDHEFEQLCLAADPDLDPSRDRCDEDVSCQLFGDNLEEFAKFLTSQS